MEKYPSVQSSISSERSIHNSFFRQALSFRQKISFHRNSTELRWKLPISDGLHLSSLEIFFRISMHDFYKFYVCPFMAVLLCEPGKECFKCNPAMRHYGSKFDKWSVTTCHPNRINHEKSSVCQYGTFQLYFSTFISAFII